MPAPAVRDAGKLLLVIGIGASCRRWLRPQDIDQLEDFREHLPRPGNLGHLERNIAAVVTIFAPLSATFSRSVVSDQCSMPCGKANGRSGSGAEVPMTRRQCPPLDLKRR